MEVEMDDDALLVSETILATSKVADLLDGSE